MGCTVEPGVVKHMDDFAIELTDERDEYVTRNDALRIVLRRWCGERDALLEGKKKSRVVAKGSKKSVKP